MRLLVAVLVMSALALPLAAQERCDADPRWLVVTVVGSDSWAGGELLEPLKDYSQGSRMLDRCYGYVEIREERELRTGGLSQASIALQRRDHTLEGQHFHSGNQYDVFYVEETVADICAALDDCANATRAHGDASRRAP